MEDGINFEVIWFDQDVIEVVASCSNGHFSGRAEIYLSHDDLSKLADGLRGFPSNIDDSRKVELGTFNPSHADGGIKMNFYCTDSSGHAVVEIKLRGDACEALGEPESVALRVPIEPAGVDSSVLQLMTTDRTIGARATLRWQRERTWIWTCRSIQQSATCNRLFHREHHLAAKRFISEPQNVLHSECTGSQSAPPLLKISS